MTDAQNQFAYVNQEFVALDRAFLHVSDLAIQRGFGVFDYFKVSNGHAFFLDDYLTRFTQSARQMGLTVPLEEEKLKEVIYGLIQKNNLNESGVKMILTGGYSPDGYQPTTPNLVITQHKFSLPGQDKYEQGIKIITHEYVRELPTAKTINYTMGIRLINQVNEKGAYDVLYNLNGLVSEFPRCNFFIVTLDNTVVTPAKNVLPGITRKNVLALAGNRYKVEERDLTLAEVFAAKEAFLTSTTKRILPIVQVDGKQIGNGQPGEVTLHLLKDLISMEEKDKIATNQKVTSTP